MCGIAGHFAYSTSAPPVDGAGLERLRDTMRHRGPDAAGLWIDPAERIGLAHRRLAIIDIGDSGRQPMRLPDRDLHITFNGEIYNYKALRRELESLGRVFGTASDTEVVLQGYAEWGATVVDRLRGMFAFAIWDGAKHGLFLARDPFGIKPLYFADTGGAFRFASEVKALAPFGGPLSAAGQVSFLIWGSVREPFTIRRDIHALPAGSTLWVDGRGPRTPIRYWSETDVLRAAMARRPAMDLHADFDPALRAALNDALVDSLKHHFVSDVPVGMFLSGGLDSGTLLALAAEEQIGALATLTMGFDTLRGTAADETPFADTLAGAYGSRHRTFWIGGDDFAAARGAILAAMDQPTVDGINVYFMSRAASAAGLKVALSGLGGDELFGGYPSFRQIPLLTNVLGKLRCTPTLGSAVRRVASPVLGRFTSPKYAGLLEFGTTVEDAYLLRRGLFMPWELPQLLEPETLRDGWGALTEGAPLTAVTAGLSEARAQVMALETAVYMRNQLLRDCDWAAMAHGLELRVPLVDRDLFTTLAPLLTGPSHLTKADMARTPRRPLPPSIVRRPKTGFTVPVRDWLMAGAGAGAGDGATRPERGLRGWAKMVLTHVRGGA